LESHIYNDSNLNEIAFQEPYISGITGTGGSCLA